MHAIRAAAAALRVLLRLFIPAAATILLGGLLSATLVRYAPGFGVDEREFDPRLNAASIRAIRQARAGQENVLKYYVDSVGRILRGDFGTSQTTGRPAAELLAERVPVTLRNAGAGLLAGWAAGLALALWSCEVSSGMLRLGAGMLTSFLLCIPSSMLALAPLFTGATSRPDYAVACTVALIVFSRVFRYSEGILKQVSGLPHVAMARARGLRRIRILPAHLLLPVISPMLALAGVSVSLAIGAAIPVEVICDSPGLGQLAWQAAMQRDLPLLMDISLLVVALCVTASVLPKAFDAYKAGGSQ